MALEPAVVSQELALIVVLAAVLAHIADRLGQPTVVAYLLTGILLGPAALDIVQQSGFTQLASELGLGFLLFFIGIEIEFDQLREIMNPVSAIAAFQMVAVAGVGGVTALLLEFGFVEAAVIGVAFAFSSTAVVVKLLADRDELSTLHGKLDTGLLLVQDLAVVLVLALLGTADSSVVSTVAGLAAMILLVAPLSFYLARNFLEDWFRSIADSEYLFFVHGVAWLFLMIQLSEFLGASLEIGAFIAGISIAQIPYSQELKHRIRPLTDLFMAVFFVEVGLSLTGSALGMLNRAVLASLILVPAKFISIFVLVDRSRFSPDTSFRSALNMVQVSEFALVLGAAATPVYLSSGGLEFISLTAIITIAASTYLISYSDRIQEIAEPFLRPLSTESERALETSELADHAVVIGYDTVGRRAAEELAEWMDVVVVEMRSETVEELSRSPHEFIYGDFRHSEVRKAAGVDRAEFIVCTAPGRMLNETVVEDADGAVAYVSADDPEHAAELYDLGAHYVIMEEREAASKLASLLKDRFEDPKEYRRRKSEIRDRMGWRDRRSS